MDARVNDKTRLPSRHVTEGPERAPHRSYYYAMGLTRERAAAAQLKLAELRTLWDVDTPADYRRLVEAGLLWNERVVMG